MFKRKRNPAFTSLLLGITAVFATLAGACHRAEDASSNSSAPKPSAAASPAAGDFEGVIAMKMENDAQRGMEMTYFLKGKSARIETKIPNVPAAQSAMLWDMDGGKMTTLFPSRKMYMTLDMKAAAEEMKGMKRFQTEEEAPEFPKLTPTGKHETIAGHDCEHWLIGEDPQIDMCIAKGLGYFGMGGQSGDGGFGAFKNLAFSPKLLAEAASHPDWVKLLEGGAFPLKMQVLGEGKVTMSMEATKIERKSLEDSLFSIPADYKEMTIPTMPGGKR